MESLKKNNKFPLLELTSRIVSDATEVFKDKIKADFQQMDSKEFAGFFFMTIFPFIAYLVLGDKYCKFLQMNKSELEASIFNEYALYFDRIVKERMLDL
jgi:hypothetical protein